MEQIGRQNHWLGHASLGGPRVWNCKPWMCRALSEINQGKESPAGKHEASGWVDLCLTSFMNFLNCPRPLHRSLGWNQLWNNLLGRKRALWKHWGIVDLSELSIITNVLSRNYAFWGEWRFAITVCPYFRTISLILLLSIEVAATPCGPGEAFRAPWLQWPPDSCPPI